MVAIFDPMQDFLLLEVLKYFQTMERNWFAFGMETTSSESLQKLPQDPSRSYKSLSPTKDNFSELQHLAPKVDGEEAGSVLL